MKENNITTNEFYLSNEGDGCNLWVVIDSKNAAHGASRDKAKAQAICEKLNLETYHDKKHTIV